MISPVHGIVIDTQGIAAGLFVTPASNPIVVLDLESFVMKIEVPQEELFQFKEERMMKMIFPGIERAFSGTQKLPTNGKNGKFLIPIPLPQTTDLYPGMKGVATFKMD